MHYKVVGSFVITVAFKHFRMMIFKEAPGCVFSLNGTCTYKAVAAVNYILILSELDSDEITFALYLSMLSKSKHNDCFYLFLF